MAEKLGVGWAVAVAGLMVSFCLLMFVRSWRTGAEVATYVFMVAIAELIAIGCLTALYRVFPEQDRRAYRIAATPVALAVVAGAVAWALGVDWAIWVALGALGIAVAAGLLAAESRRRRATENRIPAATWLVLPLVVVLCGGAATWFVRYLGHHDPYREAGEPVTAPPAPGPAPTPAWTPTPAINHFIPDRRYELEKGVLAAAQRSAPMSSGCTQGDDWVIKVVQRFPCWVEYDGARATFEVEITSVSPVGDNLPLASVKYRIAANEVIVTRETARLNVSHIYGGPSLRCDPFPAVSVVKVGAAMSQHCYYKPDGEPRRRLNLTATSNWDSPYLLTVREEPH
ncbi:hypothetical protein [Actinoplanes sp. HUAS TT8]|uniref:hypothetical protein n=1 Tax=Actinoplanes sp. HUAS TT8 TaxID=3447453 RepID=UPI003F51C3B3